MAYAPPKTSPCTVRFVPASRRSTCTVWVRASCPIGRAGWVETVLPVASERWLARLLIRPAAEIYRTVLPNPIRNGIRNFLRNLRSTAVISLAIPISALGTFALVFFGAGAIMVDAEGAPVPDAVITAGPPFRMIELALAIDPAVIRADFERAGFVLDGESDLLRNPDDDRSVNVFDPAIRGRTDRIVYRFRKPARG